MSRFRDPVYGEWLHIPVLVLLGLMLTAACRTSRTGQTVQVPAPIESTQCMALRRGESIRGALMRCVTDSCQRGLLLDGLDRFDLNPRVEGAAESLLLFYRDDFVFRCEYRKRYDRTFIIDRADSRLRLSSGYHWLRAEATVHAGLIRSSLWQAMTTAGQKPDMVMRFADLFSWDIDFFTETQAGDSFKLLVEQLYCDDRPIGSGRLQVGQYKGRVGEYYGYFYEDPTGHRDFYTRKGESVRKSFLRSPLQYSRISSHFSSGRYHPILRYVRPHHGLDYSARTGTPVSAIGDGVVVHRGWSGGYGNLVSINHGNGFQSRYGHLSRFGKVRSGSRVTQGQVIGYVGSTGMSTGPHLHFELRLNGVPRNPLRVIPPRAAPVKREYMAQFQARADSLTRLLQVSGPPPGDSLVPADTAPSASGSE